MEQFPDGAHVRLRNRVHGGYLQADEDGVGVSLRRRRGSVNVAWRVHRILHNDATFVLLHGSAYGRYLAAPPGHHRVVQGDYDDHRNVDPILWVAVGPPEGGYVALRHVSYRLLRASASWYRLWDNGVSVDDIANYSKMMHWKVEAIPTTPTPPELPAPIPDNRGGFRRLFHPHAEPVVLQRTIRVVLVDNYGNFPMLQATFQFHGRSVITLKWEVARLTVNALFFSRVVMCVRAGIYGRLTPLVSSSALRKCCCLRNNGARIVCLSFLYRFR